MLLTQDDTNIIYRGIRPLQRLGLTARELAFNNPLTNMTLNARAPEELRIVPPDPWPGDAQRGRDLLAGEFRFAGETVRGAELSWRPPGASEEWVAELHGFEWLRDLRSVGGDRARRMAREMVAGWLDVYQKPATTVWRPDVVGQRLTSWISFHDFFCASADDSFREAYFSSLTRQARWLARALPGRLSGVPLMRALKGLAHAGLSMERGDERLEQAFRLILRQIRAQILPDGTHVSRGPQETFAFLQCLVDLRAALIAARRELPEEVQHAIDRITPAVKFFCHADGGLAHFNGGQEGNAHLVSTTLMHSGARGRAMRSLPHGGYERLLMGRSSLIMDTGSPLPGGRGHAGLLGFEYAFGRDRVIVNCGTSSAPGRWREVLRATAAHTALVLDGRNACGFDESGAVMKPPAVRASRDEESIAVEHDGYMPRYGFIHRRAVRLEDRGEALAGEDSLSGRAGVHFALRFHLHPGIQASLIQDGTEVLLRARSGMGWRFRAGGSALALEDSVYCGEGETPRRTLQIVIHGTTAAAQTAVAWDLRREG